MKAGCPHKFQYFWVIRADSLAKTPEKDTIYLVKRPVLQKRLANLVRLSTDFHSLRFRRIGQPKVKLWRCHERLLSLWWLWGLFHLGRSWFRCSYKILESCEKSLVYSFQIRSLSGMVVLSFEVADLILFGDFPWKACTNMAPAFSDAARALKGIVNFGIVDCNQYNRFSLIS